MNATKDTPDGNCIDCIGEEASYDGVRCRECAHEDLKRRLWAPRKCAYITDNYTNDICGGPLPCREHK